MTPERRRNLDRLLRPRHIAFIGGRDAAIAIGEARRIGYPGQMWPVNPKRETLADIACLASVDDLPEGPDAVFLAVPVEQAVETVRKLAARDAGGIVCYAAGFGEAGPAGKAAEASLVEAAGNLAVIGPNCYGMINYLDRVALWPFAHGGSSPGYGAAIITQSGMLSSDLTMSQRSVPFTHMISIGNQAMLTIEDLVDVLCERPEVRTIGLHIEGLRDVARFAETAAKAIAHNTPIVALKTGSSVIGKTLTASHTGSLSGDDDLWEALCDRLGVIRVSDPASLIEAVKFLAIAGVPKGNRVAGFTCSGGGAAMVADHGEKIGLVFPPPSERTRTKLGGLLPPIATISNPLDYTTPIWGQPEKTRPVFQAIVGESIDSAILVQDYPAPGLDESRPSYLADGDAFADAVLAAGIPGAIACTLPENMDEKTREHFRDRGIAPMQGLHEALDAFAAASAWGRARERLVAEPPSSLFRLPPVHDLPLYADEAEGKRQLASAGIPVPQGRVCRGQEAVAVAGQLGFPVALKMVSNALLHKTEAGAVAIGLENGADVAAAVERMRADVRRSNPNALVDRFLVEAMQPPPIAELIVGIRQDSRYGLAMSIGSGGVLTELIGDAVTLLLPASAADIACALDRLKAAKLLDGFRGRMKADKGAVVAALCSLAHFMSERRAVIQEMEINPLFVYGDRVVAVDVLLGRHPGGAGSHR